MKIFIAKRSKNMIIYGSHNIDYWYVYKNEERNSEYENARKLFDEYRQKYIKDTYDEDDDDIPIYELDFHRPLVYYYYIDDYDEDYKDILHGIFYITKDAIVNFDPEKQDFDSFINRLPRLDVSDEDFNRSRTSNDVKGTMHESTLEKLTDFLNPDEKWNMTGYISVEDRLRFLMIPYNKSDRYYTLSVKDFICLNERCQAILNNKKRENNG